MNPLRLIARRLHAFFRREKLDAEMSEEIRLHLELQEKENLARGMTPEAARYSAQRSFGGEEQVKERARDQRGWVWIEQFLQDVRYGVRMLRKNPGFTTVTILTLALGIGANSAAFTAVNALLLSPLPVRAPGELVTLDAVGASGPTSTRRDLFPYPLYRLLQSEVRSLSGLAAMSFALRTLITTGQPGTDPEVVRSGEVSGTFFPVLGVPLALGRGVGPADDQRENPQPVVVLSHRLWVRRFAANPGVIGQTITIDDLGFTVVGVAAPDFVGVEVGMPMDLWLPLQMVRRLQSADAAFADEGLQWLKLMGRLAPSFTRQQASAEVGVVGQRYLEELAVRRGERGSKSPPRPLFDGQLTLLPGKSGYNAMVLAFIRPLLISVVVIVALVLFLACANVGSLLLARATARQREFAVRLGLGCGRGRLICQIVTETLLLALAGGACGILFARWGLSVLVYSFFTPELVQISGLSLNPDWRVLVVTMAGATATGIAVGLVPAIRAGRLDLVTALKQQGDAATGAGRQRLSRFLVGGQIAISVCLLAVAGLFVRTVQNLREIDLGYDREGLLRVPLAADRKLDGAGRTALALDLLQELAALPGVRNVTTAEGAFLGGGQQAFDIDGYSPQAGERVTAMSAFVGPDFFETAGIRLLRGRFPRPDELLPRGPVAAGSARGVVVVTDSLAKKYFGELDPLGRNIRLNLPAAAYEVIGVVRDVRFRGARQATPHVLFLPASRQMPRQSGIALWVRAKGSATALAPEVQAVIRRVAPLAPLRAPMLTGEMLIESQMLQERAIAQVAGFFSGLGLLLAAVGLYGVLAYDVSRRTREIGIRMALGARARDVQRLVVRKGAGLAFAGAIAGLIAAVALTRLVARMLYNVSPADPLTLISTAGALLFVALLACWLPARRATKVDPMIALRCE